MKHLLQITPAALQVAEGFYICCGKVPKNVRAVNKTSDDETEVVRDHLSDPLAFLSPGKQLDISAGTYALLTAGGMTAFQGNEATTALIPVDYKEDVNGRKTYRDKTGRDIQAFRIDNNTAAALDVVLFDINGSTQTMTEGTDWNDGATAAATATSLAAYINASVSNVSAVAEDIVVYLITEEGYTIDNLDVTGTGISHHNQPTVYDIKGNLMNADPNVKGVLPKGFKVNVDAVMNIAANPINFEIEI